MISLRHVDRIYPLKGGPYYALRNINLDVAEGDFLSVMSPSGSGKSTLLYILGLHDTECEGEYHLLGSRSISSTKRSGLNCRRKTSVSSSRAITCSMT